ncbi:MAG: carboxypeptidase regulatory-like domain-containing protein, partial [Opitutus sp.]|nr:carboxypeptidase regulatory-like domain-containing protein [Opitutus sp.]
MPMKPRPSPAPFLLCLALVLFPFDALRSAEPAATGTIEGHVTDPSTGEYLERAHVTVEGAPAETFSDTSGFYRLTNVPAGTVRVKAFFTGLAAQTSSVNVAAGHTATLDFALSPLSGRPGAPKEGEIVKLSEFLVSASREMSGAAIAINEQRFAPNIKGVVSTDEFGNVAEGSVGEFLKFLPG